MWVLEEDLLRWEGGLRGAVTQGSNRVIVNQHVTQKRNVENMSAKETKQEIQDKHELQPKQQKRMVTIIPT